MPRLTDRAAVSIRTASAAVLADLRRRAGAAATSDGMEEWHRYALPAFLDRMNRRSNSSSCGEKHQDWPARGPYTRHISDGSRTARAEHFTADVEEITQRHTRVQERLERERAAAGTLAEVKRPRYRAASL